MGGGATIANVLDASANPHLLRFSLTAADPSAQSFCDFQVCHGILCPGERVSSDLINIARYLTDWIGWTRSDPGEILVHSITKSN